ETGAIAAGGGAALTAEHEEAGGVGAVVLDIFLEDGKVVTLGGEGTRNGGGARLLGSKLGGACRGGSLHDFSIGQVHLHVISALGESLRMRKHLADLIAGTGTDEALLDAEDDLGDDLQVAVHEHVERVGNDAFGGVFD